MGVRGCSRYGAPRFRTRSGGTEQVSSVRGAASLELTFLSNLTVGQSSIRANEQTRSATALLQENPRSCERPPCRRRFRLRLRNLPRSQAPTRRPTRKVPEWYGSARDGGGEDSTPPITGRWPCPNPGPAANRRGTRRPASGWQAFRFRGTRTTCAKATDVSRWITAPDDRLLKRMFELGAGYSGQILSYTKMLGQLQDAGNTTTHARYLDLLANAGLVAGLPNYAGSAYRRRASIPKLNVLNTALMSALSGYTFREAKADRTFLGPPGRERSGCSPVQHGDSRSPSALLAAPEPRGGFRSGAWSVGRGR